MGPVLLGHRWGLARLRGTFTFEILRHWKARNDFRALGEGDALQPTVACVILVIWPFFLWSAAVDTLDLTGSQVPSPIALTTLLVVVGLCLGFFFAYERFLKPREKVLRINQLPDYYKESIGLQDLSLTFDCLWRTEKFTHLWSGFSSAPKSKVDPAWSKYYRELASYYPRRVVRWGTTFNITISGLALLVSIIGLFLGS